MSQAGRLVLAVLLAVAVPTGCRRGTDGTPAPAGPPAEATSIGILDHYALDPIHDRLERLAIEERYTEAFAEAVTNLDGRARRLGPNDPATLASLQWTASIASLGGDQRTAADLFDSLVDIRRATLAPDDPTLADTLLRRGRVARMVDDPATAWRFYAEVRRILERRGGPAALVASLDQAEASLRLRSDLEGAAERYGAAIALRREIDRRRAMPGAPYAVASLEAWLGWTLDRLGRPEEAAPLVSEARQALADQGLSGVSLEATLEQLQADQLAFQGRFAEAEPLYRSAAALNETARVRFLGGFARRVCPPDGFEALALAALQSGNGDRAWLLLERGRAALYRDLIALRLREDRDDATRETWRALRSELLEAKHSLEAAHRRGQGAWTDATWALTLRTLDRRARLGLEEERALAAPGSFEPSLEATRALLPPRTAILGYLELHIGGAPSVVSEPRRSWGWLYVLRRTGPVRWVSLWDDRTTPTDMTARSDWGPVFARIRRAAEWPLRVDADPSVLEQLRTYGTHFIDPALPLLAGIDQLVIEDTRLPLEACRGPDGRFLSDRFDVVYLPSAALLPLLSDRGRRHAHGSPRSVLAVSPSGDGLGGGAIAALALADERRDLRLMRTAFARDQISLDRLPHLHFAGLETDAVAGHFTAATVLRGGPGVEGSLRRLAETGGLSAFNVVHLATHTLADGKPERCGLVLSEREPGPASEDDGVLDAEEVLQGWDLGGALATLSACTSARAAGFSRGEEVGLMPALFAAGADRVLVSLWPVDDRATALLMDRFYHDLTGRDAAGSVRAPLPPAAALREAKTWLRTLTDAAGRRPFEHPAYWSGFILFGLPDPS
jgi:CHAT domain-containing protein/tetratricopeptide (TPR) repeat protein